MPLSCRRSVSISKPRTVAPPRFENCALSYLRAPIVRSSRRIHPELSTFLAAPLPKGPLHLRRQLVPCNQALGIWSKAAMGNLML